MVLVFTKSNRKLSFAKNSFFFVDSAIFDRIDDRDLIGIFVKDLIKNRIGKFIFLKVESIRPSDGNIAPGLFFRPTDE